MNHLQKQIQNDSDVDGGSWRNLLIDFGYAGFEMVEEDIKSDMATAHQFHQQMALQMVDIARDIWKAYEVLSQQCDEVGLDVSHLTVGDITSIRERLMR
jgi:hypothetical protein